MKYIFVINPAAGQKNGEKKLLDQLKGRTDIDYDIYYTLGPKDATSYVKNLCKKNPEVQYCFVACGGDGTVNEVLNGMFGFDNACITVCPIGSGNDYVKYYGGPSMFMDFDEILTGKTFPVDVIKVNGVYSLNVASFGFDCEVIKVMEKVKRKPLIGGKNSYNTGIVTSLLKGVVNSATVMADGEVLNPDGKYILCTAANGCYVGGGYNCAPKSVVNDGLLEVCLAKKMSLPRLLPLINKYKKGEHLDDESISDVVVYRQAKKVEVISDEEMALSVDGELLFSRHFVIENIPEAVKFIVPGWC